MYCLNGGLIEEISEELNGLICYTYYSAQEVHTKLHLVDSSLVLGIVQGMAEFRIERLLNTKRQCVPGNYDGTT